jgi:hypothetical protein
MLAEFGTERRKKSSIKINRSRSTFSRFLLSAFSVGALCSMW